MLRENDMRQTKKVWITVLLVVIAVVLLLALCCRKMPAKLSQLNDRDFNLYLSLTLPGHKDKEQTAEYLRDLRWVFASFEEDPNRNYVIDEPGRDYNKIFRDILIGYECIANKWILFGRFVIG